MTEERKQIQAVYGSRDIADMLQIQESTLRKYCLLFEKYGYGFLKNEQGHRAFFDADIIGLKRLIHLKNDADMTLEEAVKSVIAWKDGRDITMSATEEKQDMARYNNLLNEFKTFKEQQLHFNQELLQEIRSQRAYIEHRLDERDRLLMESMRETLEVRKEIAAATLKKKWWQFF